MTAARLVLCVWVLWSNQVPMGDNAWRLQWHVVDAFESRYACHEALGRAEAYLKVLRQGTQEGSVAVVLPVFKCLPQGLHPRTTEGETP